MTYSVVALDVCGTCGMLGDAQNTAWIMSKNEFSDYYLTNIRM